MTDALLVTSIDRKALALEVRARFASDAERAIELLYAASNGSSSGLVVLNTCERFEVYHAGSDSRTTTLLYGLRTQYGGSRIAGGDAPLLHLFRVASGLESRLPGEPHILGQVRSALNAAEGAGATSGLVKDAFAYAIRCGKRVRQQTALGAAASSYVERVVRRLIVELDGLADRDVAIVGTGTLALELANALKHSNIRSVTILGRHPARTASVAGRAGAAALPLAQLSSLKLRFAAVVTAVSASQPVVTVESLPTFGSCLFVDLGAAPNVDAAVETLPDVRVLRLEDLGGMQVSNVAVREAERVVAREVERYLQLRAPRYSTRELSARRRAS